MLTRGLVVTSVLLAALVVLQWSTLGRLKAELAATATLSLPVLAPDHRDEIVRAMSWLDAYTRDEGGLGRPAGLCPEGRPDVEAIGTWILDVYVKQRARGASEAESRRRVIEAIRVAPTAPSAR